MLLSSVNLVLRQLFQVRCKTSSITATPTVHSSKTTEDYYSTKYTHNQVLNIIKNENDRLFFNFEFAKSVIDYTYHHYYSKQRQINVQNIIIQHYLNSLNQVS